MLICSCQETKWNDVWTVWLSCVKPLLQLIWWRLNPIETPTCCPDLSCAFLSRLVLPCPPRPWLRRPIYDSHTETRDLDVLNDRGLPLSISVCLCPLLNPAFGSVKPLLFSPPFSLAAPGAAPFLFIHPKHCWGTPACVVMHRNHGISRCFILLVQHLWIPVVSVMCFCASVSSCLLFLCIFLVLFGYPSVFLHLMSPRCCRFIVDFVLE